MRLDPLSFTDHMPAPHDALTCSSYASPSMRQPVPAERARALHHRSGRRAMNRGPQKLAAKLFKPKQRRPPCAIPHGASGSPTPRWPCQKLPQSAFSHGMLHTKR